MESPLARSLTRPLRRVRWYSDSRSFHALRLRTTLQKTIPIVGPSAKSFVPTALDRTATLLARPGFVPGAKIAQQLPPKVSNPSPDALVWEGFLHDPAKLWFPYQRGDARVLPIIFGIHIGKDI